MKDCAMGEIFVGRERGVLDFSDLLVYVLYQSQNGRTQWDWGDLTRCRLTYDAISEFNRTVTQSGSACIKGRIQVSCLVRWPIVLPTMEASWNDGSKSLASRRWSHLPKEYCITTSSRDLAVSWIQ